MRRPLVLLALVAAVAAGCAAPGPSDAPPATGAPDAPAPVVGEPVVQDHDHADPAPHAMELGLRLVAHVKPWGDGSAYGNGTVNELAIGGDYVYVSRSNPEGGFAIVDATDPHRPVVVGDFRSEGGGDVEVTSDGRFALLATQRTIPGVQTTDNPEARAPRGVYVVDVSDKRAPRLASFFPLPPNGPHTIHYHRAGPHLEVVALMTYDLVAAPAQASLEGVVPATQRVYLTRLVRDGEGGAHLEPLGAYQVAQPPGGDGALVFPHDAFIERHPLTGQRLMYVAYWDAGLRIVDVEDPRMPREVAAFSDFGPSAIVSLHDARTFPAPLAGRHVTVVGPEIVTAPETGQLTFLDTTDPAAPKKLGWWTLPGNLSVDAPFLFSPHVFDLHPAGFVVIGHNHAGVWLIDARDPANATAVAYHMPRADREGDWGPRPSVWGARFFKGLVVATDGPTGLHFLEPAQGLIPPPAPGRVAGWPAS